MSEIYKRAGSLDNEQGQGKKTKELTFKQRTEEYIWINHIQKNSKGCPGSDNCKPKILRQGHDVCRN